MHPVVLVAFIFATILVFALPRRTMGAPLCFMAFLVPLGQQFYVAGIHLFILRLLIAFAFIKAMALPRNGSSRLAGGWQKLDTACVLYIVVQAIGTLLQNPDTQAFINQGGFIWDCLGAYFVFRVVIQDEMDVYRVTKYLAVCAAILAIGMLIEQFQMLNVFGALGGGVRAIPELRDGRVRSQGAFFHPLTAGAYAAMTVPLFVLLWKIGRAKLIAAVGFGSSTVMVLCTQTSTSVMSYMAAIAAILLWRIRDRMRAVRVGILAALLLLNAIMKSPVWWIIGHIDVTGSSSSYQRAALVDNFIRHFSQWWIIGSNSDSWGWDMWDVQNQYVAVGLSGGLLALICFVLVFSRGFGSLGDAMKRAVHAEREKWLYWLLGCALFVNLVAFFGVNYFDQVRVAWFAVLAMISAVTANARMLTNTTQQDFDRDEQGADLSVTWLTADSARHN